MSFVKKLSVLLYSSLLCITLAQADELITTELSEPGKICFPQTSLRAEPNKFNNIMLDHYLIIPKENHFKEGFVFVGFRMKNQQDTLWLFDGKDWTKHNDVDAPKPFIPYEYNFLPLGKLHPVMATFVSNYPIDVSAYTGNGEVWVGYGLTSETRTLQEAFDDMIKNQRFNLIWEVGNQRLTNVSDFGIPNTICLSITELTERIYLVTTQ